MAACTRRELVRRGVTASAALALAPALRGAALLGGDAYAAPTPGDGPYGPLQPSDPTTGIQVPKGFEVREIARGGAPVGVTGYVWHPFSDGSGTFRQADGSWIMVSNSEVPAVGPANPGGASAIHFNADGSIRDAYRVLDGTRQNCGGGTTPWGTWLSGEEVDDGLVWECDPLGKRPQVARPALGVFSHEYVVVHTRARRLYLTEDQSGGGFYRFTPARWGDVSAGVLEIATLRPDGRIAWSRVPDPEARSKPTREQVPDATGLRRPEGLCIDPVSGVVYLVESSAGKVYAYDPASHAYDLVYSEADYRDPYLNDPDNAIVCPRNGDLLVCEDAGTFDICLISTEGTVSRFVHMNGIQHGDPSTDASSETTGPCFDPSGTRLYFSSQRAYVSGAIYEVTGPWRKRSAAPEPPPTKPPGGGGSPRPGPLPLHLRLEAVRGVPAERLLEEGLRAWVTPSKPAEVTVVLRVRRPSRNGEEWITLGKATRRDVPARRTSLRVRLSEAGRRYVRKVDGTVQAQLVATGVAKSGRQARVTRAVEIRGGSD
jgi:hypothetical protein